MNKKTVVITGYFYRKNLGDDIFIRVWEYLFTLPGFETYDLRFISTYDLKEEDLTNCSCLIFGGGDVLNNYFINLVKKLLNNNNRTKCLAFSIGIPYNAILYQEHEFIQQFQTITCRSRIDANNIQTYFPNIQTLYFPDLSVYLPRIGFNHTPILSSHRPVIGVSLVRNIIEEGEKVYHKFVTDFAKFIQKIAHLHNDKDILFLPFCTSEKKTENDILLFQDILAEIDNISNIRLSPRLNVEEMWNIFNEDMYACIVMRYHAHMYAINAKVPFLSIGKTRKVKNLLKDVGLTDYWKETFPTTDLFDKVLHDSVSIKHKMQLYTESMNYMNIEKVILSSMDKCFKSSNIVPLNNNNIINATSNIKIVVQRVVDYIDHTLSSSSSLVPVSSSKLCAENIIKGNNTFLDRVLKYQPNISDEDLQEIARNSAALVCYSLVKNPFPHYHYGLASKILGPYFRPKLDFEWIFNDNLQTVDLTTLSLFNLKNSLCYFDAAYVGLNDFRGHHRSGWQYVVDNIIEHLHGAAAECILDNYVDRSFLWAYQIYEYLGIVPYSRPWCGFLHHTFDTTYSNHNLVTVFKNPGFIASLPKCRALFTLSNYLAVQIRAHLSIIGYPLIPVFALVHPTMIEGIPLWNIEKFIQNDSRSVIQIGAWLRDNYAIYELSPYRSGTLNIKKAALVGKDMNHYFKPDDVKLFIEQKNKKIGTYSFDNTGVAIDHQNENKFMIGVLETIRKQWESVVLIDHLTNTEYDILLTKNIVFLRLIDASAVNTIIECVVRNTPILVNKHPAVIEILGADYPLFYDDIVDAGYKAGNLDLIKAAWYYLEAMEKTKFTMNYFIKTLQSIADLLRVSHD